MTYTLLQQMQTPSGAISKSISATGLAEVGLDAETIGVDTDQLISIAFPAGGNNLKAVSLLSTTTLVLMTNSTTAASETVNLTADVPLMWISGGGGVTTFAVTVSRWYTSATTAGTLTARILYDPTP